jgi:hypothetical protein
VGDEDRAGADDEEVDRVVDEYADQLGGIEVGRDRDRERDEREQQRNHRGVRSLNEDASVRTIAGVACRSVRCNGRPVAGSTDRAKSHAASSQKARIVIRNRTTASVRTLMLGVMEEHWAASPGGLPDPRRKALDKLFRNISVMRVPTRQVGWAIDKGTMQHPTDEDGGVFAKKHGPHGLLDRHRRAGVLAAMKDAKKVHGATASSVVNAGLAESLAQTTNTMMAPILAKNVRPYAKEGSPHHVAIKSWEKKQMAHREGYKKHWRALSKNAALAKAQNNRVTWSLNLTHGAPPSPTRD